MTYDDYGGYVIYEQSNPDDRYYFDKNPNQMDMAQYNIETSRQQLNTFGRVPYVYYAGHTNFEVIRMDGAFVEGLCQDGSKNTLSSRKQVDGFKRLLQKRVPLVLKNSQGEGYIVDVVIEREETPKNHYSGESLDYIVLTIICTEIGRLDNTISIAHTGTGGGFTTVSQSIVPIADMFSTANLMSDNSTILGSGQGSNIEYPIIAEFGLPLELSVESDEGSSFIGWYKDNIEIPSSYLHFNLEETIEARFGKLITLNVQHKGDGVGETSVSQNKTIKGQSNGSGAYSMSVVEGVPINPKHFYSSDTVHFVGWEDINGNMIDFKRYLPKDNDTIFARFEVIKLGVNIVHQGGLINSSASQDGFVLASEVSDNIIYGFQARIDKDIEIAHSVDNTSFEFVGIVDEFGKTYTNTISSSEIREGMKLTITYEMAEAKVTFNHVGQGGGTSAVYQFGNELHTESGSDITYSLNVDASNPIDISVEADSNYSFLELQNESGEIITSPINNPYDGMVVNVVFAVKSVEPDTNMEGEGSNSYHEQLFNLGSKEGDVRVFYSMGSAIPDKMEVWYGDSLVATTSEKEGNTTENYIDKDGQQKTEDGFVLDTGSLTFPYNPTNFDYNIKVVIKPAISSNTRWLYRVYAPTIYQYNKDDDIDG